MDNCHDHAEHNHSHGGHHAMTMDDAMMFLRRFWYATALLVPLLLVSNVGVKFLGTPDFEGRQYVGFAISTIIFYFSLVFFEHATHEIKAKSYGMMTLVSLAVASGFLFSVASTFIPSFGGMEFFLEISTLIWVLLFGHYLEAKSTAAAGSALQEVAKLLPKEVHLLVDGQSKDVPLEQIKPGDTVIVKPGEKLPADGVIIDGQANMDEALVTGESKPISKKAGDKVIAGSICLDGSLTIRLEKVGLDSTVGHIQQLVETAQTTKPKLQYLADRVASLLTFVALGTAIATVLVWTLVEGQTFAFALTLAVTVLVIACPHALGLAIPTVSTTATSLALKNGIFLKSLKKLEAARNISVVAFDKTGTLTEGKPAVTDIVAEDENKLLTIASALEAGSSHPLARAVLEKASESKVSSKQIQDFKNLAGQGVTGRIDGQQFWLGNEKILDGVELGELEKKLSELSDQGKTVAILRSNKEVLGLIAVADKIRPESKEAVDCLHQAGVKVAMITGDNEGVAKYVAVELGIDTYFSSVLPEDKYKKVKELQDKGEAVMMVGDGVNDAPALIQANVGVAIGAGTDVTVEAGDIILIKNNPADISRLLVLSKKVYTKMIQNLVWAVGYNVVAIPAAAGVFSKWGLFLRPDVGAFLMAMSSVIVVVNALQLKRIKL
ncbi:MAG: heavy metal translocating P-type ATPase [Candidatus Berkelbacteria bacterium]|nr:heavy metal translocating P-type ATPase [Candidatus Berkelbacteria bacterium]MCR4307345.1 heavy metal translocating P-type ATPase [Candidatus Berkelbacteria bacterium]